MTVAGFEKFMLELCGDPDFAPLVGEINRVLEAADIEADGNPDADRLLAGLEYIATEPQPLVRRIAKMHELTGLRGKVVVNLKEFCGW
jgi:hypothetical protein